MWSLPQAFIVASQDGRRGHDPRTLYDRPDGLPVPGEPATVARSRIVLVGRIRRLLRLAGA